MSDVVLLGRDEGAARVRGYGLVPADVARALVRDADKAGRAVLRRLYAAPLSGQLVAVDSRSTNFQEVSRPHSVCATRTSAGHSGATPPARPVDHARSLAEGGETDQFNGQGLCEACNIAKEALGGRPDLGLDQETTWSTR